jgi:hypothetical protein
MRKILLLFAAAAGLAAEPAARLSAPVLGYVFDSASKSMRPIGGIPGAAALEGTLASASKLETGFVSQNRRLLLAATLDGAVVVDLSTSKIIDLPGAPTDIALGAWSADSRAFALWSRSGGLQVWANANGIPSLRFAESVETMAGLAVANDANSVLYWGDKGLFLHESGGLRQLVNEPVFGAALRGGTTEWAAVTGSQLLRSNAEPTALTVSKPTAVAFATNGVVVAGEKAVGIVDETGSRTLQCDCDATSLEPLAGRDIFRLTGLDADSIAVYDGDSAEARILYIPNEGGRR